MPSNIVGQVIAKQFRVDAFIASGGMGSVFRVWDLKRNVPLAMKVLHADLAEDPVIFERFKREARALRKLEHPNIVPFYGLYETPALTFLLERFIDGPTLKDILAQRSGSLLPDQDVLCIIKSLCSAVGYAHNNNVIHCDIKAANVMLERGGHIYLGDFGIARHAESDATVMPGAGTPAYMAPEQIMGNTVSQATDIYALGILLFELLTGRRPFRGTESGTDKSGQTVNERIRFAQVNLPAPDPRLLNPKISPQLSAVVLRSLEKEPSARFSTCQDLLSALCEAYKTSSELIPDRISILGPTQENLDNKPIPVSYARIITVIKDFIKRIDLPTIKGLLSSKNSLYTITGAALVMVLIVIVSALPPKRTLPLANTNTPDLTPTLVGITETATALPTATLAPTLTATVYGTCPGAEPQQVKVGDTAVVCTTGARLIVHTEPKSGDNEIFRIYPRTYVEVIDGPICEDSSSWWKIRINKGSKVFNQTDYYLDTDVEGWVREGSDGKETPYFICRVD